LPSDGERGGARDGARGGPLWSLGDLTPRLGARVWIAPTASVIGDVELGPDSNVWFACVLRGDTAPIRIGARANIQDGSVLHVTGATIPCILGDDVTVGHMSLVHACTLEDRAFVGMGAQVLDGAVIEEEGMLAAGALLTPGKRIGRRELWAGRPARKMRDMSADERAEWDKTAHRYVELAQHFRERLRPAP
jgi:gamma-carbonic anhydrase